MQIRRLAMGCSICPRNCGAKREDDIGFCSVKDEFMLARAAKHEWEEPCISGVNGSGTVFFSGCSLRCAFCQNYEVSRASTGAQVSEDKLMRIFDSLVEQGVHNINLVTPTHYTEKLAAVLEKYKSPVPVVWNSSGYEKVESLKMLEGLVDIYLPDIKFFDAAVSQKYAGASDYFEYASKAVLEMFRQVGTLETDENGMAKKGVLIRHLVLPGNVSQSFKILEWISGNLPEDTAISLMSQYVPYAKAKEMPPLDRRLSSREYSMVKQKVMNLGFENVFFQQKNSASEDYIPQFNLEGLDL